MNGHSTALDTSHGSRPPSPSTVLGESMGRLALLIDADNAQPAVIESLLAEVARFGEATVRRIYGDFTSPASAGWKEFLNKHSIALIGHYCGDAIKFRAGLFRISYIQTNQVHFSLVRKNARATRQGHGKADLIEGVFQFIFGGCQNLFGNRNAVLNQKILGIVFGQRLFPKI